MVNVTPGDTLTCPCTIYTFPLNQVVFALITVLAGTFITSPTFKFTLCVCVTPPPVARIVRTYSCFGVIAVVEIVNVEFALPLDGGVRKAGLNTALILGSLGVMEMLSDNEELNPSIPLTSIL
jgi:hypothetical protein